MSLKIWSSNWEPGTKKEVLHTAGIFTAIVLIMSTLISDMDQIVGLVSLAFAMFMIWTNNLDNNDKVFKLNKKGADLNG